MNEVKKKDSGQWYNTHGEPFFYKTRIKVDDVCFKINTTKPSKVKKIRKLLKSIGVKIAKNAMLLPPVFIDYGYNLKIGKRSFINHYAYLMDCGPITIGDRCRIGPFCGMYTDTHAFNKEERAAGFERALPITIGDDVWIGGNVTILGGVTIGSGSIIGAKSLVKDDIPPNVIAVGNPCKVIREITEKDKISFNEE